MPQMKVYTDMLNGVKKQSPFHSLLQKGVTLAFSSDGVEMMALLTLAGENTPASFSLRRTLPYAF